MGVVRECHTRKFEEKNFSFMWIVVVFVPATAAAVVLLCEFGKQNSWIHSSHFAIANNIFIHF